MTDVLEKITTWSFLKKVGTELICYNNVSFFKAPSQLPTNSPSCKPSVKPSYNPTYNPTSFPSDVIMFLLIWILWIFLELILPSKVIPKTEKCRIFWNKIALNKFNQLKLICFIFWRQKNIIFEKNIQISYFLTKMCTF